MKTLKTVILIGSLLTAGQVCAGDKPAAQVPAKQVPATQTPAVQVPAVQTPATVTPAVQRPATPGTQAIYRSIGQQLAIGNSDAVTVTTRGFLVLDPDGLRATAITGYVLNGARYYSVLPLAGFGLVKVTGAGGLEYTVLARAEAPGATSGGVVLDSVYARGLDVPVTIDSAGVRMLPRSLPFSTRTVSSDNAGVFFTTEGSSNNTLDVGASRLSSATESFENAVARLAGIFAARGYVEVVGR